MCGVQQLRCYDARLRYHVALAKAPVRGHLAPVAVRIIPLGEQVEHRFTSGHTEDEVHGKVAVVGCEVIDANLEGHRGAHLRCLLAGAGDNERGCALPVEQHHALVQASSQEHVGIHPLKALLA